MPSVSNVIESSVVIFENHRNTRGHWGCNKGLRSSEAMSAFSKKKRGSDVISINKLIDLSERYQNGFQNNVVDSISVIQEPKKNFTHQGLAHRLNWCQL